MRSLDKLRFLGECLFSGLKELRVITIAYCPRLGNHVVNHFANKKYLNLNSLHTLILNDCNITNFTNLKFNKFNNLLNLSLRNNKIKKFDLAIIGSLKKLKHISFKETKEMEVYQSKKRINSDYSRSDNNCPKIIESYLKDINIKNLPFLVGIYSDEIPR